MDKTVIRTESAPAPFQGAPYNQAIRVGESWPGGRARRSGSDPAWTVAPHRR